MKQNSVEKSVNSLDMPKINTEQLIVDYLNRSQITLMLHFNEYT